MANLISKIKAPNNTEYLLKDSTLAADTGISIADIDSNNQRKIKNTGVTGVKGNSESAYRTGQVNLTAANIGAKATQSAVNDIAADGTSVTFISQVTQNAQGVISPVKKTVATMGAASADAAGSAGLVPAPAAGKQGQYLRGDGTWATPSNTTYTFDGTYNSSTNKAATVSTVTNAINALDVEESTGTTLQTITAISETNGKIATTYSDIASASTSGKGVVQLSSATNSTSTSLAATASAVKAAYDLAASKTANTGTVTKVTPGNGLINGTSGTSQTAITSTGTISIKEGGVTNAMLAGSIENGKLSNSKVTIAGNDVSLGGSVTADTLRESLGLSNAMHFVGTTTTAMSDGLTTKNVTINSKTYTPNNGDVVLYSDAEFVWTGSAWERLGRDSSFKTTQTAVTDPSADGTATAFINSITQNVNGVITPHKASLPTATKSVLGIVKVAEESLGTASQLLSAGVGCTGPVYTESSDSDRLWAAIPAANSNAAGAFQPGTGFTQIVNSIPSLGDIPIPGAYNVATMGGATSSADGTFGAPPSPKKGDQAKFLRGDATWQSVITAHRTYTAFTGKPAANATPGFGESFTISQIAQSTTGQVSGTDRTVTIPALPTASTSVAGIVKLGTAAGTAAQGNHNHDSTYVNVSGDTMTGSLTLKPSSGEGGQLNLSASNANTTQAGITLDQLNSQLRIFGIASADGTTKTGTGTALVIDPYAKTITGGYTITGALTGHASSDLALSGGTMTGDINRYYGSASTDPMLKLVSNNQDAIFFDVGHGTSATATPSSNFQLKYIGTGSDPNNMLVLTGKNGSTVTEIFKTNQQGIKTMVGAATLSNGTAASATKGSSQLVLGNTNGTAVGLELRRGGLSNNKSGYASWQIVDDGGRLRFKSDYNSNGQSEEYVTEALQLEHTTGAAVFADSVSADSFNVTHQSGGSAEYRVHSSSDDVDMWLGIGTGNENHGLYDAKNAKWMIWADKAGNVTVNGGAASATTASKLSNTSAIGGTDHPVYFTNGGIPAKTTYRMAGTNATATTALAITDNLDTGIWYVNGTNSTALYSQTDGAAYANKYSDSWIHEIYGDYRTGHIAVRGKNNGTWKDWYKVLDSGNYDDFALPLSGGTMTGALNLANNTWNQVGDDAYIGDINKGGHIGIQGKNGNTGLFFTTYNQTSKTTGAALTWDGTQLISDKSIKTPTIICTDTGANAHVNLSRTGGHNTPNYINVPASGALAFSVGGAAGDRIVAMVESDKVIPFNTNETDIGTSSYQWKSMHSQTAVIDQHVTLQYNSTDASLDFVFA